MYTQLIFFNLVLIKYTKLNNKNLQYNELQQIFPLHLFKKT